MGIWNVPLRPWAFCTQLCLSNLVRLDMKAVTITDAAFLCEGVRHSAQALLSPVDSPGAPASSGASAGPSLEGLWIKQGVFVF